MSQTTSTPSQDDRNFLKTRLLSLDVYRGLIMVSLFFVGFGMQQTAKDHLEDDPASAVWQEVKYQFSHAQWVGCSYWDMIQPSFMFMVGVSMAYSYSKRKRMGDSWRRMFFHALWRSIVLICLGIFLTTRPVAVWTFVNVLTQIGLGYTFLFLLWDRKFLTQASAAVVILVGTWILYVTYPNAGVDLETGSPEVGVSAEFAQEYLAGVAPAWHKNANVGQAVDVFLLNWLPRGTPFEFNQGGYQTINFIPSLATMLFGLMCGELLRLNRSGGFKLAILVLAAIAGLALGWLLDWTGVCPMVKRIWTPGWAIFSTGWCCLILGTLYVVVDLAQAIVSAGIMRVLTFPLVVVGMNSIAAYCMSMSMKPWIRRKYEVFFGEEAYSPSIVLGDTIHSINPLWAPTVQAVLVGLVVWLFLLYMYRHKIFIRI